MTFDVAIVGAGILGLAHAIAARRRGKRVVVIERDAAATGASIRNFGFVTVTGQAAGDCFEMALAARGIWDEVMRKAGIAPVHHGLLVTARRPEAEAVIDAFLATAMAEGCRRLSGEQARRHEPLIGPAVTAALFSPREVRVESREALPRIAAWLAEEGVAFRWRTAVRAVCAPRVETSAGPLEAETVIVCPGDDDLTLFPERLARYRLNRCKLHMMRLAPARPARLAAAVMSDLGLARYAGYAALPEAAALAARLDRDQPGHRANGVHLIAVGSADGTLVVGDSHHYAATPDPFRPAAVDDLILSELDAVLPLPGMTVTDRWIGTYASADDRWRLSDAPDEATRIVIVTAGCGASTAFAVAEETLADLYGGGAGGPVVRRGPASRTVGAGDDGVGA